MKIALGISGSIASYRSADFIKQLVTEGHDVRCVLTHGGQEFVSVKALETFSGNPVYLPNMFGDGHFATDHIATARWADCFIVYGATANFLARLTGGLADDFLNLQLLAFTGPVILAPAMNPSMWENAAVVQNVSTLKVRGYHFVEPVAGVVACGEAGVGHIASDDEIIGCMNALLAPKPLQGLIGKKILISVGPMRTAIDPVRYIQNRSSGKMGLALAEACRAGGAAKVEVLLGPVAGDINLAFQKFSVQPYVGPSDYQSGLEKLFTGCDVFFSAAAVLDFETIAAEKKIERATFATSGKLESAIRPVPDMVAAMAAHKTAHQKVIAFAAETGSENEIIVRATAKMQSKNVDAMIANPVEAGAGPDSNTNIIWILRPNQAPVKFDRLPKTTLGTKITETLFAS
jgi:phosphopantothenoylcysteine decarboxylase/phosphopantothenate--cysteine ligase